MYIYIDSFIQLAATFIDYGSSPNTLAVKFILTSTYLLSSTEAQSTYCYRNNFYLIRFGSETIQGFKYSVEFVVVNL